MGAAGLLAMVCVGAGLALGATGLLARVREKDAAFADIFDLAPDGPGRPASRVVDQHGTLVENTIGLTSKMIEQMDPRGGLRTRIERARVPLRAGEFVLVVAAIGLTASLLIATVTGSWVVGMAALLATPFAARGFLGLRITRRKRRFEAAFPDALMLVSSSLSAGHTFLRAIQIMCTEVEGTIAEEFARVVAEIDLGIPVVDALDRMAQRIDVRDVEWVVQAIRIQQQVGGKLAELLATLADFIRARDEVRREIDVLTAEGRLSAWVLGALPVLLFLGVQVLQPGYMDPLLRGWGLAVLAFTGCSMTLGVLMILRMVRGVAV